MSRNITPDLAATIEENARVALAEDSGLGDLSAPLIPVDRQAVAQVICRQNAILCGTAWFDACFRQTDPSVQIHWFAGDGDCIDTHQALCEIRGTARALLIAERPALNFLQTLSATATRTHRYVQAVQGIPAIIMDTRKTLPGLRIAQKYAVHSGGGINQRMGLFDGILIKENHLLATGSIAETLRRTEKIVPPDTPVQIEVESLTELEQALDAGARLILLDNFSLEMLREAVRLTAGRAALEASGGITLENVQAVAETGVQRISVGSLTKDILAVDLSLRFAQ